MTPYRCVCGTSVPAADGSRSQRVVCGHCGRELVVAGPNDVTQVRELATNSIAEAASPTALAHSGGPADFGVNTIGPYCQLEQLGRWRHGDVYKAFHPVLQRHVILRTLSGEHAQDHKLRERFIERAAALAKLNHPHVIDVLEAGNHQGIAYVAEELFEGEPIEGFGPRTVRERWNEGLYPSNTIHQAMLDAASGLATVHHAGITHDHLGPATVLVNDTGTLKLAGFFDKSDAEQTRPHVLRIAQSRQAGPVERDIISLGVMFFTIVTGQPPGQLPARSKNVGVSRAFDHILGRCLAIPPRRPYDDARSLINDLTALTQIRVSPAHWWVRVIAMFLDMFLALSWWGFLYVVLLFWLPGWLRLIPITSFPISSFIVMPTLYVFLFEALLGWTPIRRLFGLRLVDSSGDPAAHWSSALRAVLKLIPIYILFTSYWWLTLVAPHSTLCDWVITYFYLMLPFIPIVTLGLVYAPALWTRQHQTFHDLLTGVQLAQRTELPIPSGAHGAAGTDEASSTTMASTLATVDQYEVSCLLGEGGMGSVYRARDRALGRVVAIKTLSSQVLNDEVQLQRFHREARLAAQLNHPHVAKVYGAGRWGDCPYIAMEFIDGENLHQVVQSSGPLKLEDAWRYCIQAAEGLREADRYKIVHRDIKPSNLMVTRDGKLKVTDFGISRTVDTEVADFGISNIVEADVNITKTGTILGTAMYMSPEQAMGREVDRRSDIYSLGMTMHYLLAGRPPFQGNNAMEVLAQQVSDYPPSLVGQVSGLTEQRAAILRRMMSKNKDTRYADYGELLEDLFRERPDIGNLAGLGVRFAAELANFFLVAIMSLLVSGLLLLDPEIRHFVLHDEAPEVDVIKRLIFATSLFLVYVFGEGKHGKTMGKRWAKIRVTRLDGSRVGYGRAALRFLLKYPAPVVSPLLELYFHSPSLVRDRLDLANLVLLVLSAILMWRTPKRRAIHDILTGTVVVRVPQSTK